MNEAYIRIEDLSKTFDLKLPPALQKITTTINKGQLVGLAGPDGAGKTTLLRLLAGLLLPSKGRIYLAGFDTVQDARSIHHILGYMPQKFGLYEDLSVLQNLTLYAELRGLPKDQEQKTFEELLKFTELASFQKRLAKNLSGGMKQKLGLACALIRKPDILLLDEPTVGVDPISRKELWKMVLDLLKEGITVLWSTAYLDEAERCDQVLLLNEGNLLYAGTPKGLTEKVAGRVFKFPVVLKNKRQALQALLNHKEVMDGTIQGDEIRIVAKEKDMDALFKELASSIKSIPQPASPRFEDAFIDILGGGPGGNSKLAEITPSLKSQTDNAIVADHLTKAFGGFTAVSNISFKVPYGQIYGLLGPNGAGKSTTFKMLCGLLKPSQGTAWVGGLDLQLALGPVRSTIGYMAQKFSLYGNLTVLQNLQFFSGIYNLSGKRQQEALDQMIQIFDLSPYLSIPADLLPLGFKQRLALSCATMHNPQVLFLDEPTSGVDPLTRREFWNHINGLVEKGVTVMVTTHFMDEAEYCDSIGLIYRGKMIHSGTPSELKKIGAAGQNSTTTLEEAFIKLIEVYDADNPY